MAQNIENDVVKKLREAHGALAIVRECNVGARDYINHMTFRKTSPPLFSAMFGPLVGLKEEWRAQGALPGEIDHSLFKTREPGYFGLPIKTGFINGSPEKMLEESDEKYVFIDAMGRTMTLPRKAATLALPSTWPVKTMEDWKRLKPHYEYSEERMPHNLEALLLASAENRIVTIGAPGAFDEPRQLLGEEEAAVMPYLEPELIADMLDTMATTFEIICSQLEGKVKLDRLFIHEDLAGKSGPLWGPIQFRQFSIPYYQRIWTAAKKCGAELFEVDSDGDINPVLEEFIEGGINVISPCEPEARMDIVSMRKKYGNKLAFTGGIDKYCLLKDKNAIDKELEYKIGGLRNEPGILFGLDHRIPNGVPIENYRYFIKRVWEFLER